MSTTETAPAQPTAAPPGTPVDRRWFLVLAGAFLATRLFGVHAFVPHNDETIYALEARDAAKDWSANKYITLDGRQFGDYRQPLLCWLTAWTVSPGGDPLVGVRTVTLAAAAVGFAFVVLLVSRVCGPRAALWTGWLYVLSAYYGYFDCIALNEPLLYGLACAYLWALYESLTGRRWLAVLAAILVAGMLLTKDSARVWVLVSALVPPLAWTARYGTPLHGLRHLRAGIDVGLTVAVAAAGFALHATAVPAAFDGVRAQSPQAAMTLTPAELAELPIAVWRKNVEFLIDQVLMLDLGYFGLLGAAALCAAVVVRSFRTGDRSGRWIVLLLASMFAVSCLSVAAVAKIDFVRYYGTGLFLLYAAVATAADLLVRSRPGRAWPALAVVVALVGLGTVRLDDTYLPAKRWGQSDLGMSETPGGWANGLGLPDLKTALHKLGPGVVLLDPQWGFPQAYVELYRAEYPRLGLIELSSDVIQQALAEHLNRRLPGDHLYLVLDSVRPFVPDLLGRLAAHPQFVIETKTVSKTYRDRKREDSSILIVTVSRRPRPPAGR